MKNMVNISLKDYLKNSQRVLQESFKHVQRTFFWKTNDSKDLLKHEIDYFSRILSIWRDPRSMATLLQDESRMTTLFCQIVFMGSIVIQDEDERRLMIQNAVQQFYLIRSIQSYFEKFGPQEVQSDALLKFMKTDEAALKILPYLKQAYVLITIIFESRSPDSFSDEIFAQDSIMLT